MSVKLVSQGFGFDIQRCRGDDCFGITKVVQEITSTGGDSRYIPMHILLPVIKAANALGLSGKVDASSHRSGLNSSASSPHTGCRWMPNTKMKHVLPDDRVQFSVIKNRQSVRIAS